MKLFMTPQIWDFFSRGPQKKNADLKKKTKVNKNYKRKVPLSKHKIFKNQADLKSP
jgi:hypothetical protein